jgi:hypothetical protein
MPEDRSFCPNYECHSEAALLSMSPTHSARREKDRS